MNRISAILFNKSFYHFCVSAVLKFEDIFLQFVYEKKHFQNCASGFNRAYRDIVSAIFMWYIIISAKTCMHTQVVYIYMYMVYLLLLWDLLELHTV